MQSPLLCSYTFRHHSSLVVSVDLTDGCSNSFIGLIPKKFIPIASNVNITTTM
jgi:hypothetical protein